MEYIIHGLSSTGIMRNTDVSLGVIARDSMNNNVIRNALN